MGIGRLQLKGKSLDEHAHHWVIETQAVDHLFPGVCKICGAEKRFNGGTELNYMDWKAANKIATGKRKAASAA